MSERTRARVEDGHGKLIAYVEVELHKQPKLIRDTVSKRTFEAQLDDYCCFSHYAPVNVVDLAFDWRPGT